MVNLTSVLLRYVFNVVDVFLQGNRDRAEMQGRENKLKATESELFLAHLAKISQEYVLIFLN